jgi:hypothetical protein
VFASCFTHTSSSLNYLWVLGLKLNIHNFDEYINYLKYSESKRKIDGQHCCKPNRTTLLTRHPSKPLVKTVESGWSFNLVGFSYYKIWNWIQLYSFIVQPYAGISKKGLAFFGKYIQPTPILLLINILFFLIKYDSGFVLDFILKKFETFISNFNFFQKIYDKY